MTAPKFLLVPLFACVIAACSDKPASTPADRSASAGKSAKGSSSDTVKVQGVWSDSVTAESGFTAEYVNDTLVVIEEQMIFADGMRSIRAYFYDRNFAPTRIFEHRALTAASGNSTPKTMHSLVNIYLTGDKVDSSTKTVDLVPKPLQPYDIENLRKHERLVFARVTTTSKAP
jgi:hypothetical protein